MLSSAQPKSRIDLFIVTALIAQLLDLITFLINYDPISRPELNPIMAALAVHGTWLAIPFKAVIIGIMFIGLNWIKDKPRWPIALLFVISGVIGTLGNIGVLY